MVIIPQQDQKKESTSLQCYCRCKTVRRLSSPLHKMNIHQERERERERKKDFVIIL